MSEAPQAIGTVAGPWSLPQAERYGELRSLVALTYYPFVAMMRNVATFAFGFLFPVVFISVFGLIGGGSGGVRLGVATGAASAPVMTALEGMPNIVVVQGSQNELERQLELGKIEGVLDLQGGHVVLQVNEASPQSQAAPLFVQSALDRLNLQVSGVTAPPYTLEVGQVAGRRDRYIDFALPGQVGFALLSTAIFGTVFGLLYLKKALILKRLFATPVHGLTILLGQGLARLIVAVIQAVIILALGVLAFGFQLANGWTTFIAMLGLSCLGLIVFLGFGLVIAGRVNDENGASPITNLVTLPQFLLSGVFFPTDVFPAWVRVIADNLPLSYFNAAMRQIATEGAGVVDVAPYVVGLCVWGVVAYGLAARTFKWV
ncbi:MAG: ABC transporter permease [Chloroflexi bacterium]|nr:ABC transporter permease [Chloroflexota bacterium]